MNRGYIFIFLATVFFSSMEVALKTVAHDFNPMQLNCTRFLVGGLLLIPFALSGLRQHGARVTAAAWKGFAWLGFVGLVVSMMFYQMSILYAPASVVSVLFSCNPVLVLAFAYLILRADIRPQHITALVMEVAAALIIIDPLHTTLDPVGITLVLLSAATFALYAVLGKKQCAQYSGVAVTCFSCLAASAEMIVLMLISHIPAVADALQAAGLPHAADLPLGIMVETPAAVLIADALARECDFFSIGTNDLIHYLMAIDRNNLHVGYLNEALHPAVVRSLKRIIDSAHREGIGVSVCGELAADPYGLALLLGMGVDTLSASPRFVPGMKHMIRRLDAQTCMDMAHSVLMSTDVTASQRMLRERLQESLGSELAFHTTSIMTNS